MRVAPPSALTGSRKGDGEPIGALVEHEGLKFRAEDGRMNEESPPPMDRGRIWPLPAGEDRQISVVATALRQRRLPPAAILDGRFRIEDATPPETDPLEEHDPEEGIPLNMSWGGGDRSTNRVMVKTACELLAYERPDLARTVELLTARNYARWGRGTFQTSIDTTTNAAELEHVDEVLVHSVDVWTRRASLYFRFVLFTEIKFVGCLASSWPGPPVRVSYSFDTRNPSNCRYLIADGDGDWVVRKSARTSADELGRAAERLSERSRSLYENREAFRAEALSAQALFDGVTHLFESRPWPLKSP